MVLLGRLKGDVWGEIWGSLNLQVETLASLGLPSNASDSAIWHQCQQKGLVLITNNRNARGPDSLAETIRLYNTPVCLPVFTLANANRVLTSNSYAEVVVERLLGYLLRIDELLGTGRLFIP